jgi:DNA-binding transcriptional regulator GbsR (MarR family)
VLTRNSTNEPQFPVNDRSLFTGKALLTNILISHRIFCLTGGAIKSVISVMTEITDIKDSIPKPVRTFVLEWGNLGERWGVNRSVSQVHALLYASKAPLAAEQIADTLGIARSNVSNSLRELQTWNIIRSVPVLGDRRTFYTAETDLWNLVSRIAAGRKARELDPAAAALRECVELSRDDKSVDPVVQLRLREMLDFVERTSRWYDQMLALPRSSIITLMKLGGGIARLIDRGGKKSRDS